MTKSEPLEATAATELYTRWGPVVYRRCLRLLRNPADAQDATQSVFILALRNPSRFENTDEAIPWLYSIATNYCFNQLRNAQRREAHQQNLSPTRASSEDDASQFRLLASEVLGHVSAEEREVAIDVLLHGYEHQELADHLGVSQKTVQRRLHRFLERARQLLAGEP